MLDILLVSLVVGLRFGGRDGNRAAVHTAMIGLAVTVLCDALFTSPELRNSYHSGELLDAGWFAGSLLLAWAPWSPRWRRPLREHPRPAACPAAGWPPPSAPSPRTRRPPSAPPASSTTPSAGARWTGWWPRPPARSGWR
ncbi:hypothetical protein ACFQ0M_31010 [Kitasatospora aburaviensis]